MKSDTRGAVNLKMIAILIGAVVIGYIVMFAIDPALGVSTAFSGTCCLIMIAVILVVVIIALKILGR